MKKFNIFDLCGIIQRKAIRGGNMEIINEKRNWMKSDFSKEDFVSDQMLEKPQPPLCKEASSEAKKVELPKPTENILRKNSLYQAFNDRVSHRSFLKEEITLEELSFLLWATQGVKSISGDNYATLRTVPSAGARHPYETYIAVNWVKGLQAGIYRYLPLSHELEYIKEIENQKEKLIESAKKQKFAGNCAVNLIWACIPYRGEWRYSTRSHKPMLLDAGHICQNLYLACEAIGCGTCAIAAYDQKLVDDILGIDGEKEFTVYMSPVGRVREKI